MLINRRFVAPASVLNVDALKQTTTNSQFLCPARFLSPANLIYAVQRMNQKLFH